MRDNFPAAPEPGKSLLVSGREVLVLGDNRGDSMDSRYFGFITRRQIVGSPVRDLRLLRRRRARAVAHPVETPAYNGPVTDTMKRLLYAALAVLFLVAAASQTTYTVDVLRLLQGSYPVRPFDLGEPWPTVRSATRTAFDASLYDGDRILAIEGHEVRGMVDLDASVRAHRPGDWLRVTVNRDGQTFDCQVIIQGSARAFIVFVRGGGMDLHAVVLDSARVLGGGGAPGAISVRG